MPVLEQPVRQSALLYRHEKLTTAFTMHHGWRVAQYFTSPEAEANQVRNGVGLADVSWMARFDLKGSELKTARPVADGASCWRLGPSRLLLTCEPPVREEVLRSLAALERPAGDLPVTASVFWTEVTSVYSQFLLAGPHSRDVLRKLTSLNVSDGALPNLACGQASLAHIHTLVLRQDLRGLWAFHLLVSREYGESFWDSVLHAGHEFHLLPFGLDAHELLKGN